MAPPTFTTEQLPQLTAQSTGFPPGPPADPNDFQPPANVADKLSNGVPRNKDGNGYDEEAVVYNFPRLLEDPTGRLRKLALFHSMDLITFRPHFVLIRYGDVDVQSYIHYFNYIY